MYETNWPKTEFKPSSNDYITESIVLKKLQEEKWPVNFEEELQAKKYQNVISHERITSFGKREHNYYKKLKEQFHGVDTTKLRYREKQQWTRLNELESKIKKEQKEYVMEYEERCKAQWLKYKDVDKEIQEFIVELMKRKLRVARPFACQYTFHLYLPLEDLIERGRDQQTLGLASREELLTAGMPLNVDVLPKEGVILSKPFLHLYKVLEFSKSNFYKKAPLGNDPLARWLATSHGAKAIVTLGTLHTLLSVDWGLFKSSWEMPVSVFSPGDGGDNGKVVLVHQILPRTTLSSRQQTAIFLKYALRHFLTEFHRLKSPTSREEMNKEEEDVFGNKAVEQGRKEEQLFNQRVTRKMSKKFQISLVVDEYCPTDRVHSQRQSFPFPSPPTLASELFQDAHLAPDQASPSLSPDVLNFYHKAKNEDAISYIMVTMGNNLRTVVRANSPLQLCGKPVALAVCPEYQPELGFEKPQTGEVNKMLLLCDLWPNLHLLRTHIEPLTSRILLTESLTRQDLISEVAPEVIKNYHRSITMISNLLEHMVKFPVGEYLLTHLAGHQRLKISSKDGAGANLKRISNMESVLTYRERFLEKHLQFGQEASRYEDRPLDMTRTLAGSEYPDIPALYPTKKGLKKRMREDPISAASTGSKRRKKKTSPQEIFLSLQQ